MNVINYGNRMPTSNPQKTNGLATAAFVLGLLSVCLPYIGIILGTIGLIMGISAGSGNKKCGFSTAGIVLSIFGIIFSIGEAAFTVYAVFWVNDAVEALRNIG